MACEMKKMFAGAAAGVMVCGGVWAGEFHWTGTGGDGRWTNRANWAEDAVPGQMKEGDEIVGDADDTAYFGAVADGAATVIDLENQYAVKNIRITAGAPAYVFGTEDSAAQVCGLATGGGVWVEADVVNDQTFLRPGMDPHGTVRFQNDSPAASLVYRGLASITGSGGYPYGTHYLYGVGRIVFDGPVGFDQCNFWKYGTGPLVINDTSSAGARYAFYRFMDLGSAGVHDVEIPAGGTLRGKGGTWPWSQLHGFSGHVRLHGDGVMQMCIPYNAPTDMEKTPHTLEVSSGRTVTIDCGVVPRDTASKDLSFLLTGDGTFVLNGTNSLTGPLRMMKGVTVCVRQFGHMGDPAGANGVPANDLIVYESSWTGTTKTENGKKVIDTITPQMVPKATLKYTGPGGDTDRTLMVSNLYVSVRSTNTFANAGTGAFRLDSDIVLAGASGATFRFAAETAPLAVNGAFEAGKDWDVIIGGDDVVTYTRAQTYTGATHLNGGTLALESLALAPATAGFRFRGGRLLLTGADLGEVELAGAVFESGANTVGLAAGTRLTLAWPELPDGARVDFIVPDGAADTHVKLTGAPTGLLSETITWNGMRAEAAADGVVTPYRSRWARAESGDWSDGTKWDGGVPAAGKEVYVTAAGASYTVSAADVGPDAFSRLDVANAAADAAAEVRAVTDWGITNKSVTVGAGGVLSAGAGKVLTVRNTSGGGVLTLETNGVLRVMDGGTGRLETAAGTLKQQGGRIEVQGAGVLQMTRHGEWSATLGTGRTVLSGTAVLDCSTTETAKRAGQVLIISPNNAGETAELTVSDAGQLLVEQGFVRVCDHKPGGRAVLNLNGTSGKSLTTGGSVYALALALRHGTGEVNMTQGNLSIGNMGMYLGTVTDTTSASDTSAAVLATAYKPEGVFNLSGGTVTVNAYAWHYGWTMVGLTVGCGIPTTAADTCARGTYNISGGKHVTSKGTTVLGAGKAVGVMFQTGGTFEHNSSDNWNKGDGVFVPGEFPMVIGLGGGCGTYTLAGGTAKVMNKNTLFIGGASKTDLHYTYTPRNFPEGLRTAEGTLVVTGGVFTCANDMILGADGTGTLALGGTGAVTAKNVVLSNQTASVLKYTLDAASTGSLTVTDTLTITDGARLEIDASKYALHPQIVKLASAGAVAGVFGADAVHVVKSEADTSGGDYEILYTRNGENGLWLKCPNSALLLIFR